MAVGRGLFREIPRCRRRTDLTYLAEQHSIGDENGAADGPACWTRGIRVGAVVAKGQLCLDQSRGAMPFSSPYER